MNDTVSVIIPVYNGERYLAEAIASALGQTHAPHEVIVIDDASTDGTAAVAQADPRVIYDRLPVNGNTGVARNRGVELASGEWIAFLDADDTWNPDKLRMQLAHSHANGWDMAFCHARQFISPDLPPEEAAKLRIPQEVIPAHVAGTMLIRRRDFLHIGLFKPLQTGEFIEWYTRAHTFGFREGMIDDVLMFRRVHDHNKGRTNKSRRQYLDAVRARLKQKREARPLPAILQTIFETRQVIAPDGTARPLHSHIDRPSALILQHLVREARATRVIEVGFAYGISSLTIAAVIAQTPGVTYDIIDSSQSRKWEAIGVENMRRAGYADLYTLHEAKSERVLPRLLEAGQRCNFAFIDGNHTFDHALIDFFYINKMLDVGGIVVFDDAPMNSIRQVCAHVATYPAYERVPTPTAVVLDGETLPLEVPGRFGVFRKIAPDERKWDWHVNF